MSQHDNLLMNYRFKVLLDNNTVSFSKVSGLNMEVETEMIVAGGQNHFGHIMETPVKRPHTLRMESGIYSAGRNQTLRKLRPGMYLQQGIVVMVCAAAGSVQLTYCAEQAYVTKWELSELSASSGSVLVNVFEAVYTKLSVS